MKKILALAAFVAAAAFAALAPAMSADADAGLEAKLDKIVETQEKILAELAEIKAELKIVKVRATMK